MCSCPAILNWASFDPQHAIYFFSVGGLTVSKEDVEKLLLAGGADKEIKYRYNQVESKEKFVEEAKGDGYEFTVEELDEVLKEEGLDFASYGNPRCRSIWLR
jgi:hypothetical protein